MAKKSKKRRAVKKEKSIIMSIKFWALSFLGCILVFGIMQVSNFNTSSVLGVSTKSVKLKAPIITSITSKCIRNVNLENQVVITVKWSKVLNATNYYGKWNKVPASNTNFTSGSWNYDIRYKPLYTTLFLWSKDKKPNKIHLSIYATNRNTGDKGPKIERDYVTINCSK